jgi:hypothetical protein
MKTPTQKQLEIVEFISHVFRGIAVEAGAHPTYNGPIALSVHVPSGRPSTRYGGVSQTLVLLIGARGGASGTVITHYGSRFAEPSVRKLHRRRDLDYALRDIANRVADDARQEKEIEAMRDHSAALAGMGVP